MLVRPDVKSVVECVIQVKTSISRDYDNYEFLDGGRKEDTKSDCARA